MVSCVFLRRATSQGVVARLRNRSTSTEKEEEEENKKNKAPKGFFFLFYCVLASLSLSLSSSRLCTSRNVFNREREREPSCPEAKLVWYTQSRTPPPTGSPSIAPSCCCCCRWKALIQHNVGRTLCTALLYSTLLYSLPTFDDFPFQLFGHPLIYIARWAKRARQAHTHVQ